jgi:hypothetical protein
MQAAGSVNVNIARSPLNAPDRQMGTLFSMENMRIIIQLA